MGFNLDDDIVTRLRGKYQGQLPICDEAADEIERLRRALQLMSIDMRTQLAGMRMRCKCGGCE